LRVTTCVCCLSRGRYVAGLLCIANSAEGGESQVVSSVAIWNELVRTKPRLAEVLTQPFPVDRKGEVPPGKRPTYDMPVFHRHGAERGGSVAAAAAAAEAGGEAGGEVGGEVRTRDAGAPADADGGGGGGGGETTLLSGIYDRNFIASAQARFTEEDGVPRLTPLQVEALDALDALCADDRLRLDIR
jgi:hypothetical protein